MELLSRVLMGDCQAEGQIAYREQEADNVIATLRIAEDGL